MSFIPSAASTAATQPNLRRSPRLLSQSVFDSAVPQQALNRLQLDSYNVMHYHLNVARFPNNYYITETWRRVAVISCLTGFKLLVKYVEDRPGGPQLMDAILWYAVLDLYESKILLLETHQQFRGSGFEPQAVRKAESELLDAIDRGVSNAEYIEVVGGDSAVDFWTRMGYDAEFESALRIRKPVELLRV